MQNDTVHSGYNAERDWSGETTLLHAHADELLVQDHATHENGVHALCDVSRGVQKYNDDGMVWDDGYNPVWRREEYSFF